MTWYRVEPAIALAVALCLGCTGEDAGSDAGGQTASPADSVSPSESAAPSPPVAPPAGDPSAATVEVDVTDVPWAVPLQVRFEDMIRQRSGLWVQVLAEGTGRRATPGDSLAVHYRVWLPNGSLLDASYEHDPPEPLPMQLGVTGLIDGWTEGVTGMRVGERRRLVVPHDLAYGPPGRPGVPPYSPLLFEVELIRLVEGALPPPEPGPDGGPRR
ncbi:MAG: FKBP-type peptidyl-prolyl cis-trans isomerase [Gemmatimonadota bacterium]|nr:FKBP-type peptidyl-prolyl cis-trans isomerase [Gemmatimonadota bacterium]